MAAALRKGNNAADGCFGRALRGFQAFALAALPGLARQPVFLQPDALPAPMPESQKVSALIQRFLNAILFIAALSGTAALEAQNHSDAPAREVNRFIAEKTHNIESFVRRTEVVSAFAAGDREKIGQLKPPVDRLGLDITDGRLLFPDDPRLGQARNFVAREMFFQAVEGQQPPPQAVKPASGRALMLALAITNPESTRPPGALVTRLRFDSLKERFRSIRAPGAAAVMQKLCGIPDQAVLSVPSGETSEIKTVSNTDIPHREVHFTASRTLTNRFPPSIADLSQPVAFFVIAGLLLACLAARITCRIYRNDPPEGAGKKKFAAEKPDATASGFLQTIAAANKPQPEPVPEKSAPPEAETTEAQPKQQPEPAQVFPGHIFREYDIRGIYNEEITQDFAQQLGRVLGTKALALGELSVITAFDGRVSSPALCKALEQGIIATGCNVVQIGQVPTPLMNFATHHLDQSSSGVMVTASHNPAEYNGFKITLRNHPLKSAEVQELKLAMAAGEVKQGMGGKSSVDVFEAYKDAITLDVIPATELKVVVDAANGVAGGIAPKILEELGCTVIPLHCDVDGTFPNHEADTTQPDNLRDLVNAVKAGNADLGIGLDGDGDRLVAVAGSGEIVWPDQLMMIFARDVISRKPGADIVFDVKSTRRLNSLISSYGGRPVVWKTGHSNIRNKTLENNAPLGGEFSGHIFFRDRWYGFDDGIYAAARLIEIMTTREQSLEEMVSSFEASYSTPEIKVEVTDREKFNLVETFADTDAFADASISRVDGIRVEYPDAWGLLRASNTTPALTLRFEAATEAELDKIQAAFRTRLQQINSRLTF